MVIATSLAAILATAWVDASADALTAAALGYIIGIAHEQLRPSASR